MKNFYKRVDIIKKRQVKPSSVSLPRGDFTCRFPSLSYLRTWLYASQCGGDDETVVGIDGREYHALALEAHHLARCKVGHEEHVFAYEVLGLVVLGNAGEDGAVGV